MNKQDIHLYDIRRILFGNVPGEFYIELIIRALFVYLIITFGMKLMGKRISAGLNRTELAAISTLAAATGLVLMAPERGLLPAIISIMVLLFIKWYVHHRSYDHPRFEKLAEGIYSILVLDGVLQLKNMDSARVSHQQLFAVLREKGLLHLGMVKRLYMEASGSFSLVKNEQPPPGLAVLPPWDNDFLKGLQQHPDTKVCINCGNHYTVKAARCTNCHQDKWTTAVSSPEQ